MTGQIPGQIGIVGDVVLPGAGIRQPIEISQAQHDRADEAEEELIPLANGRSEVSRILAGTKSPKFAAKRSTTACAYLPQ